MRIFPNPLALSIKPEIKRSMEKNVIKVVCEEFKTSWGQKDVNSLMYLVDGTPIMGNDVAGNPYHLGQISSSFNWAKWDIENHFIKELEELFPNGYEFQFEFVSLPLEIVNAN